ncbi:MAG TPA: hypothetical protein PK370_01095 [Candidatus Woesebacteria bacterium]|nr:hypothetical protein [Candidatus Woesebacteria bacterium]HPJ17477.1 hypothetical protein [Candidatus Woesebacteria bacterium]
MNRLLAVKIDPSTGNGSQTVGSTFPNLGSLISIILQNALTLSGIIFLCLLIFGGLNLIINAGSGDSKKAAESQAIVVNSLIGFAITLLAFFIIQIIEKITGLSIINSSL